MEQKKRGIARRAVVGTAKAWAWSLGVTSLSRTLVRIGGNMVAAGRYVRDKLKDGPENYRHETFEQAVERLRLDEARLIRQARAFNVRANSWFAAFVLAGCWMAYLPFATRPVSFFLIDLGIMMMTFSKAITARFRFCQIRDAELYSFGPWFFNLTRW